MIEFLRKVGRERIIERLNSIDKNDLDNLEGNDILTGILKCSSKMRHGSGFFSNFFVVVVVEIMNEILYFN